MEQGYCRIELELKATSGDLQCQWSWNSKDFGEEPIPASALFVDKSWLPTSTTGSYPTRFLEASHLLLDLKCVRCHNLGQSLANQTDFRISGEAPDLIDLSNRRTEQYIFRKILDPHFESSGAEMPKIFNANKQKDLQDVRDLTAFLRKGKALVQKVEPRNEKKLESGERLFEQLGCIGCHHLPIDSSEDKFDRVSLKFTAEKFTSWSLRKFLLDPHRHAPYRKMGNFGLSNEEADYLAAFIEKYSKSEIKNAALKNLTGNSERGKSLFKETGCANCHRASDKDLNPNPIAIQNTESGCLSSELEEKKKAHPTFSLTRDEKQLLAYHLNEFKSGASFTKASVDEALNSFPVWRQTQRIMKDLRCGTCHTTEKDAAKLPEIVFEEGVLGLNPERLPNISQVGNKLHTRYLESLLNGDENSKARPWLKTRMPSFGGHALLLAQGISNQAGYDHRQKPPPFAVDKTLAETGLQLTGQNVGLDCRQCHGVGDLPPRGDDKTQIVLGVNFSMVSDRIRPEYYKRWMIDPLRIDPQTKMPKYSADGKSTKIREIFNGEANRQYQALWHYLKKVARENR